MRRRVTRAILCNDRFLLTHNTSSLFPSVWRALRAPPRRAPGRAVHLGHGRRVWKKGAHFASCLGNAELRPPLSPPRFDLTIGLPQYCLSAANFDRDMAKHKTLLRAGSGPLFSPSLRVGKLSAPSSSFTLSAPSRGSFSLYLSLRVKAAPEAAPDAGDATAPHTLFSFSPTARGVIAAAADAASSFPPSSSSAAIAAHDDAGGGEAGAARVAAARSAEMFGTALVLSFLQACQLMPLAAHGVLCASASSRFSGATALSGRDFATLYDTLLVLHSTLRSRRWLERARLWRLVLTQRPDGAWDASDAVAFALAARPPAEVSAVPRLPWACKAALLPCLASAPAADEAPSPAASPRHAHAAAGGDCPLAGCTAAALVAPMPAALAALPPSAEASRVWVTMCCLSYLEPLNISWLRGDGGASSASAGGEATLVDAAHAWLGRHTSQHSEVAAALYGGALVKASRGAVDGWHRAWKARIAELRSAPSIVSARGRSYADRVAASAYFSLRERHELFATFLAEPSDGVQRWQRWIMVLTSCVCVCVCVCVAQQPGARENAARAHFISFSRLTRALSVMLSLCVTNTWFYYVKAVNCCSQLRSILNSGPDGGFCPSSGGPCRGFDGDCGALRTQFEALPVRNAYASGLASYACDAFPNSEGAGASGARDTFLVALIGIAVAAPVTSCAYHTKGALVVCETRDQTASLLTRSHASSHRLRVRIRQRRGRPQELPHPGALRRLLVARRVPPRLPRPLHHIASLPLGVPRHRPPAVAPLPLVRALRQRPVVRDPYLDVAPRRRDRHLHAAQVGGGATRGARRRGRGYRRRRRRRRRRAPQRRRPRRRRRG